MAGETSTPKRTLFETILIDYRWVFVCFFLLPVSVVYDGFLLIRNKIVFALSSAPQRHNSKVKCVQKQVAEWAKQGKTKLMCTARPGWQTISFRWPKYKDSMHQINVNLVDILEIDTDKKILRVEPMVTMGQLTAALNPLGWTIPVVPEIDDLTVGGLVAGTGIESSSHLHGLFQHACVAYELVTADGQSVRCSADEHSDLFHAVPWAYGTVGILTAVEIRLVRAHPYVRIAYEPVRSCSQMVRRFSDESRQRRADFVEGLMFDQERGVLMTGTFADAPDGQVNRIGRWYKPWFFVHVRNKLRSDDTSVEYIPLRDYYHRHTKAIFWELQDIIPFGNHAVFRHLFGWMVPPKISLLKLTQTAAVKRLYENNHVIQDMLVPIDAMQASIQAFHDEFQIYPLWLCPFALYDNPGFLRPANLAAGTNAQLYVDIGVYGVPKAAGFKPRESTRRIERFVVAHKGYQMLYADTYMTRDEYRGMFDHRLYDAVRERYGCKAAFPDVYDKVSKAARM